MKKTLNRKIIIIILLIIVIYLLKVICIDSNPINKILRIVNYYGEPIEDISGIINNEYFNIYSDGSHEEETTNGINEAIRYCSKNNISNIKLRKGIYAIKGAGNFYKENGILMCSNITLDLNSSTIHIKQNNEEHYTIISIFNAENVEIKNGILIGDKETHDYSNNKSHQWGFGVDIRNANNVVINNLEIYNMTGDGLYISNLNEGENESISIKNNNIHDCRRQGISIICGSDIIIEQNEIYSIRRGCATSRD